ncbi:MAG: helix-turn-helix domain-containing protein [Lachnospiraceae bacterium]|nr:helix-turn-helix domain-containing protein [Lachnospiraceae bacterium]
MYREGAWPDTPDGISARRFRKEIRAWVRIEDANGPEVLKHQSHNKNWTPETRYELVARVLTGNSITSVALEAGINSGTLYQWVRKYKTMGYNGLVDMKKGRQPKDPKMKKINFNNPRKLEESEYEELIRLRAENEYIKAENAVIKKEIALREEKEAARLKAKKQRSSKNSGKKDTN